MASSTEVGSLPPGKNTPLRCHSQSNQSLLGLAVVQVWSLKNLKGGREHTLRCRLTGVRGPGWHAIGTCTPAVTALVEAN